MFIKLEKYFETYSGKWGRSGMILYNMDQFEDKRL